jgi:replication-associated recombination protein RarA
MLDTAIYDKHRPKTVDDIVGNTDIWKRFHKTILDGSASHTVLVGPAGCGKTLFLKLALLSFPTLYIDCTANFGLRDVRDSIRTFARGSRTVENRHRWLIFEHADALTSDAQAFLRRMLETTSGSTRIVFECRDSGAISEPILSRSSIISVNAPDNTEAVYEVRHRTEFKLSKEKAEMLVRHSCGNMRSALLHALACIHCEDSNIFEGIAIVEKLLNDRPKSSDSAEWIAWACESESACRIQGIDLRDLLRIGWPNNPIVAYICAQWSRLGGTSPRTLFFNGIAQLHCVK